MWMQVSGVSREICYKYVFLCLKKGNEKSLTMQTTKAYSLLPTRTTTNLKQREGERE